MDPVPDASPDAAAATAAFTVLSSVPGADQAALAKTLEESLKPVTDTAARAKGAALASALPMPCSHRAPMTYLRASNRQSAMPRQVSTS